MEMLSVNYEGCTATVVASRALVGRLAEQELTTDEMLAQSHWRESVLPDLLAQMGSPIGSNHHLILIDLVAQLESVQAAEKVVKATLPPGCSRTFLQTNDTLLEILTIRPAG